MQDGDGTKIVRLNYRKERKMKRLLMLLGAVLIFMPRASWAETINLKSGQRLENVKITEKTKKYVKVYNYRVQDDGKEIGSFITYKTSEIDSIKPDKINRNYSLILSKVILKSGEVKIGKIVDVNKDSIKLKDANGVLVTCFWNDVVTVNGQKAEDLK